MPVSFKRPILVKAKKKTDTSDLVYCDACGGINALGRVAVKVDCTACDSTGYSNYFTTTDIPAYYIPGAVKRWSPDQGGVVYMGETGIKVDEIYEDAINEAEFLEYDGRKWQFTSISDPGRTFGQRRLLLALSRKE